MPLYDYRCDTCADEFEQFASAEPTGNGRGAAIGNGHSEANGRGKTEADGNTYAEPACPSCGSRELTRVFKPVAISTSEMRRGRVVDMSSGSCPHHHHGHGMNHAH